MATIGSIVLGLLALVLYVMILIKMFQNDAVVIGIICIVTCFLGPLIALVYGWIKAGQWKITNLMIAYTASYVLAAILGIFSGGPQIPTQ